jgi:hypothetical protein
MTLVVLVSNPKNHGTDGKPIPFEKEAYMAAPCCRSLSTHLFGLDPPNHTHCCSRFRGVFPCWELQYPISDEFICDDCADDILAGTIFVQDTHKA